MIKTGWDFGAFCWGAEAFTEQGIVPYMHPPIPYEGSIEQWKADISPLTLPGNESKLLVLVASFAAPLLGFFDLTGAQINFVAPAGGGKTSLLWQARRVWGDTAFFGPGGSTEATVLQHLDDHPNLPILLDNVPRLGAVNFPLTSTVANGVRTRTVRTGERTFCTLLLTTSSERRVIQASDAYYKALEIEIGGDCPAPLSRTSGVAGRVFMNCLLADKKYFMSLCHSARGAPETYRWVRLIACLKATTTLLIRYGLLPSTTRLVDYLTCVLDDHIHEFAREEIKDAPNYLYDFISGCRGRVIVVRDILPQEGYKGRIVVNPRNAPDIRVEQCSRRAFLRKESLAAFCRKQGISLAEFLTSLGDMLVEDNVPVSMGLYSLHVERDTEAVEIDVTEDSLYDYIRFGA